MVPADRTSGDPPGSNGHAGQRYIETELDTLRLSIEDKLDPACRKLVRRTARTQKKKHGKEHYEFQVRDRSSVSR